MESRVPCLQELSDDDYNETWRVFAGNVPGSIEIDYDVAVWRCGEYDSSDDDITLHIRCAQILGVIW